jgi:hypothetical protein
MERCSAQSTNPMRHDRSHNSTVVSPSSNLLQRFSRYCSQPSTSWILQFGRFAQSHIFTDTSIKSFTFLFYLSATWLVISHSHWGISKFQAKHKFWRSLLAEPTTSYRGFLAIFPATSHDLLLDLAEALGTLVNSRSVDVLSTEIGEALLTLCLTASVINEDRHSEILHTLKALEKVASPRIFTSLILRTSLANFDDTTACWLSILRSHHLINLAKALEHAVASFHAGDVPHRRPYKRKRKASLEPGPSHDSDEWDHREEPGRGKRKQTKVKGRNGTPSESSVSWVRGFRAAEKSERSSSQGYLPAERRRHRGWLLCSLFG